VKSALAEEPGFSPGDSLDLLRAIEIALASNPEVAAARWSAEAARSRYDIAAAGRLPTLDAVGGYMYNLDEQRLLPVRSPGDPTILGREIVSGDLTLSMPLFTGGRLISQVRAADFLRQSADHQAERSREELVFNVSSVFFGILSQERLVSALEFSRGTLEQHLARVDALVAARKAAPVDRMRTEVRLADVAQRLVRERNVLAVMRRVLVNLLAVQCPADSLSLRGNLEMDLEAAIPDAGTTVAKAFERRPDYLSARAALQSQARLVDAARAAYWPSVSLLASYGERWAVGTATGTGDNPDDIGRVGLVFGIPLFEGGRIGAAVQAQRAEFAAARERLRKFEMQIRLDVETALLGLQSSRERIEATQKAVDQARESLRIEQQKYELGKGAIVDVLDAQSALLESETNYYRALADFHTAWAQLRLAEGDES
jgi:outer membrane protein TolC